MRLPKRTEIETAIHHTSHPADYIMFAMSNIAFPALTERIPFNGEPQLNRGR
jgi:hypothetical protein